MSDAGEAFRSKDQRVRSERRKKRPSIWQDRPDARPEDRSERFPIAAADGAGDGANGSLRCQGEFGKTISARGRAPWVWAQRSSSVVIRVDPFVRPGWLGHARNERSSMVSDGDRSYRFRRRGGPIRPKPGRSGKEPRHPQRRLRIPVSLRNVRCTTHDASPWSCSSDFRPRDDSEWQRDGHGPHGLPAGVVSRPRLLPRSRTSLLPARIGHPCGRKLRHDDAAARCSSAGLIAKTGRSDSPEVIPDWPCDAPYAGFIDARACSASPSRPDGLFTSPSSAASAVVRIP